MPHTPSLPRAFERINGAPDSPLILTCEHASKRVPIPWRLPPEERSLLDQHWGHDLGAASFTRTLAKHTRSPAVLARFSRLLCDANRQPDDPSCFVREIEGRPLRLNQDLSLEDRRARLVGLHEPYHDAIDQMISQRVERGPGPVLLSVHSFTPVWAGQLRRMDVGLLFFEPQRPLAEAVAGRLGALGLGVALEEPYSAQAGLAWSVEQHALRWGLAPLELELNQALLPSARAARALARILAPLLCA